MATALDQAGANTLSVIDSCRDQVDDDLYYRLCTVPDIVIFEMRLDSSRRPWITGSPAFAGDDDRACGSREGGGGA